MASTMLQRQSVIVVGLPERSLNLSFSLEPIMLPQPAVISKQPAPPSNKFAPCSPSERAPAGTDSIPPVTSSASEPITDYAGLRAAFAERRKALGLTQHDVDYLAFIADGATAKLECGTRRFGDISLAAILAALGVALVLVPVESPTGSA
jgi:hypothetical protein